MTKSCPGCDEARPLSEFWRDASRPDGRQRLCVPCSRARVARAKAEAPEAHAAANRAACRRYYLEHREAILAKRRAQRAQRAAD